MTETAIRTDCLRCGGELLHGGMVDFRAGGHRGRETVAATRRVVGNGSRWKCCSAAL